MFCTTKDEKRLVRCNVSFQRDVIRSPRHWHWFLQQIQWPSFSPSSYTHNNNNNPCRSHTHARNRSNVSDRKYWSFCFRKERRGVRVVDMTIHEDQWILRAIKRQEDSEMGEERDTSRWISRARCSTINLSSAQPHHQWNKKKKRRVGKM